MEWLKARATWLAFALGAAVWVFSPFLTGRREAWDAGGYYLFTLTLAGLIPGLLGAPFAKAWLSVVFGQLAAIVLNILVLEPLRLKRPPDAGLFFPLGVVMLVLCSVPAAVGAALGLRGAGLVGRLLADWRARGQAKPGK